jgi:tetratricopeptide (TPR) repeat protein
MILCLFSNLNLTVCAANDGIMVSISQSDPAYFTMAPPNPCSGPTLLDTLRTKLTREELGLVVNPLESDPQIDQLALQLTLGATDEQAKARLLFKSLASYAEKDKGGTEGTMRTARQVFAAWNNPKARLYCKDYALFYVVLARAAGITAYEVDVQEEADGQKVPHACAAVFFGQRCLLVDAAYMRFGISHKRFRILSDVQSIAMYMSQLPGMEASEIACKLAPDLALVQLNHFEKLILYDRMSDARELLPVIKHLNISPASECYEEGSLALSECKPDIAIKLLLKAIEINPHEATYHHRLALAYAEEGNVTNMVASLEKALQCPVTASEADDIRKCINNANIVAADFCYRYGYQMQIGGNLNEALRGYEKAISLKPPFAEAYFARGTVRQLKGNAAGAAEDYNRAVQLNPELRSRLGR